MSSEIIVVLVLVALAVVGLVYLEMHSRGNKRGDEHAAKSEDLE